MKRSLFYKILFSYLVIICVSFFLLDIFMRDEGKNVRTARIENELFSYAKMIDLTGKTLYVAGYTAADTTAAVSELIMAIKAL